MGVAEKTMFEIYRERDYNRAFRYILYTELEEHARHREIARAAAGDTVFHGFFADQHLEAARAEMVAIVDQLNEMDEDDAGIADDELRRRLGAYMVQ
ncbi:MAG: hypothetical protein IPK80_09290 [Nannocystis sp.]|jgi:hypothetical protein|nr:hypothetical protein [Nannocystis sp.]